MIGISTYSIIELDRVETLWCFWAPWGENSKLCSKMQIGLVEMSNSEQRNKILAYVKRIERFIIVGGVAREEGLLRLICWPYNY